jgi:hypothetical protein
MRAGTRLTSVRPYRRSPGACRRETKLGYGYRPAVISWCNV